MVGESGPSDGRVSKQPVWLVACVDSSTFPTASTLNVESVFEHIDRVLKFILVKKHVFIGGIPDIENLLRIVIHQKFGLAFCLNRGLWVWVWIIWRCVLFSLRLPILVVLPQSRRFRSQLLFMSNWCEVSIDLRNGLWRLHLDLFVTYLLGWIFFILLMRQISLRYFR